MELGIDPSLILKLNLPKKLGISAAILLVILALYGYVFFTEMQTQIETLDSEIAKQDEEIQKKEASLRKKPQLEKELAELSIKEAEASKVLPQEKQIPDLLATVSNKATIQGLKNKLFQPKPEIPSGIYATIPIDLEVHGGYHQLGMFFDDLAKLFRIVKVNEFAITPLDAKQALSGDGIHLNIKAKASTYRFVNKAPELPGSAKKGKSAKAGTQAAGQKGAAK